MSLFAPARAPVDDRWRILTGSASDCIEPGAALVHADPPWSYSVQGVDCGSATGHYELITNENIAADIAATWERARPDAYLFVWCTWPKLGEWMDAAKAMPWTYKTGGSWHKNDGRTGIGFHVRGNSEPWLLYTKGKPRPLGPLSNAYASPRQAHSEKPAGFLASMIAAMCPQDGLVLDLYAGRAPCGVAAKATGRRYLGIEIDDERAEIGRRNIASAPMIAQTEMWTC